MRDGVLRRCSCILTDSEQQGIAGGTEELVPVMSALALVPLGSLSSSKSQDLSPFVEHEVKMCCFLFLLALIFFYTQHIISLGKMYKTNFITGGTNITFFFSSVSLHRESLLHLAVRWALPKLFHFLLCLPGGVKALKLPNEEATTPLDLALQGGHSTLVEDITK